MSTNVRIRQMIGGEGRCPLAASSGLIVYHVYEDLAVTDGVTHLSLGRIYGDPQCAVIAADQSWCAAGGAGVTLARAPAGRFLLDEMPAVVEVGVKAAGTLWVGGLFTLGDAPRVLGIFEGGSTGVPQLWQLDVDSLVLSRWPVDEADDS